MYYLLAFVILVFTSCTSVKIFPQDTSIKRSDAYQLEIDSLLEQDKINKHWQRVYLAEIKAAEFHMDRPSYKFFVIEFLKVPIIPVPEWMENEPNYTIGLTDQEIADAKLVIIVSDINVFNE